MSHLRYTKDMKLLCEIRHSELFPDTNQKTPEEFSHRRAARAIVTNDVGEVALLYVGKYKYHKLPGGGIEEGENITQALERELLEEIGCQAEVIGEVGEIIEYRDAWGMMQTSYCYLAKQIGIAVAPDFTEKELSEGFEIVWAKDMDAATILLNNDDPQDYGGRFISTRDRTFLAAAL
jgi:8-oxo-dGTP pyrophosphatase MutT (NUDIX family)